MRPQFSAYASPQMASSRTISRAVFRASLDVSQPWHVTGRGTFVPASSAFEMILLPANGYGFQADVDSWEIELDMPDPAAAPVPEPATGWIAAAGLLSVLAANRLRK